MRYQITPDKYLLPNELEALRLTLQRVKGDERNKVLIELALATGARAEELLAIKEADLLDYDHSVHIRGLKGSNDRELPLRPELFARLKALAKANGGKPFPISYSMLVKVWHQYRPVAKKFHSLRHTFAVELYKREPDIKLVQLWLGHRQITNTMVYLDLVYSKQKMAKGIL